MGQPCLTPCFPSNHSDRSLPTLRQASLAWLMALNASPDTSYLCKASISSFLHSYLVTSLLQMHKTRDTHSYPSQSLPQLTVSSVIPAPHICYNFWTCLLLHYLVLCHCSDLVVVFFEKCTRGAQQADSPLSPQPLLTYLCKAHFTGIRCN